VIKEENFNPALVRALDVAQLFSSFSQTDREILKIEVTAIGPDARRFGPLLVK
jgi:hypothetical protein